MNKLEEIKKIIKSNAPKLLSILTDEVILDAIDKKHISIIDFEIVNSKYFYNTITDDHEALEYLKNNDSNLYKSIKLLRDEYGEIPSNVSSIMLANVLIENEKKDNYYANISKPIEYIINPFNK